MEWIFRKKNLTGWFIAKLYERNEGQRNFIRMTFISTNTNDTFLENILNFINIREIACSVFMHTYIIFITMYKVYLPFNQIMLKQFNAGLASSFPTHTIYSLPICKWVECFNKERLILICLNLNLILSMKINLNI